MSETWHCSQIPSGDGPLVVCERERLTALVALQDDERVELEAHAADIESKLIDAEAEIDRLRTFELTWAEVYTAIKRLNEPAGAPREDQQP